MIDGLAVARARLAQGHGGEQAVGVADVLRAGVDDQLDHVGSGHRLVGAAHPATRHRAARGATRHRETGVAIAATGGERQEERDRHRKGLGHGSRPQRSSSSVTPAGSRSVSTAVPKKVRKWPPITTVMPGNSMRTMPRVARRPRVPAMNRS